VNTPLNIGRTSPNTFLTGRKIHNINVHTRKGNIYKKVSQVGGSWDVSKYVFFSFEHAKI
jgi:hypothetical protein